MRFLEFKLLPQPVQAHFIYTQGVLLSERRDGDYLVALYALSDFYVEVHYRYQDSEVLLISSFFTTNLLAPYLATMPINHLLQGVL